VHHPDAVADAKHNGRSARKVVQTMLLLELLHGGECLRFHQHVQCGGRLVADLEFGLRGRRPRNVGALPRRRTGADRKAAAGGRRYCEDAIVGSCALRELSMSRLSNKFCRSRDEPGETLPCDHTAPAPRNRISLDDDDGRQAGRRWHVRPLGRKL